MIHLDEAELEDERRRDDEAKRRLGIDDEDPKVLRDTRDKILERSDQR